ncbi:glycine zipper 2TM domain-containing protein [Roseateles koreensis]|uniref:Glycine zipper 2TM domain-containing protein n=1 Tax=Roseateles koreensis TaxID=2987526 RepID=A0ABT5KPT9_9BURK|nr:glycine zipper 2TM domain-containing protein [Roseateles koreensis]MDC8784929.1 glycine zipper 2TM domain-containing protein [Roseateles koreensis]
MNTASQRSIGIVLLLALLAGVYALGRSQSGVEGGPAHASSAALVSEAPVAASTPATAASTVAAVATPASAVSASAPPAPLVGAAKALPSVASGSKQVAHHAPVPARQPESSMAPPLESEPRPAAKEAPALCAECATVAGVQQVQREGQASGIGAIGGAVLGGLLGNQIGGGNGKKLATVGGAAAGGYFGNEMEKKQKARHAWVVRFNHADGSSSSTEYDHDPQLRVGEVVRLRDGEVIRQP